MEAVTSRAAIVERTHFRTMGAAAFTLRLPPSVLCLPSFRTMLIYRGMTASDLEAVAALERKCFSSPWPKKSFEATLTDQASFSIIVEQEGNLIGYLIGFRMGPEFLIANLAVRGDHRRRGIGAELLRMAVEEAERLSSRLVILDVRQSNLTAIKLYRRFGFRVLGRKKSYYSDPVEDAIVMGRFLA